MPCNIRLMTKKDLPQVAAIDREAFPTMWPPVNFNHELTNRMAHYIVASDGDCKEPPADPAPVIKLVPVRSFLGIKWPFSPKTETGVKPASEETEFIAGFLGMWLMVNEAHIINIAVRNACRGKGIGEQLLIASIDMALKLKATVVTLEVRASNTVAQNLYTKYGFKKAGLRKGYYTDNREDAYIMTTDTINSSEYLQEFHRLKEAHFRKLGPFKYEID